MLYFVAVFDLVCSLTALCIYVYMLLQGSLAYGSWLWPELPWGHESGVSQERLSVFERMGPSAFRDLCCATCRRVLGKLRNAGHCSRPCRSGLSWRCIIIIALVWLHSCGSVCTGVWRCVCVEYVVYMFCSRVAVGPAAGKGWRST